MLDPYRVIDLTDERGNLAAFILAGLGADVVLVEPPDGAASRRRGPFAGDVDDGEHSLTFWGWNRGKRSVVLDLDTADGQAALAELCAGADAVIECGAVPVDLAALRAANPALVTASITPFGATGPKADWPATDLTVNAAGCQLAISGDEDRAPVRTAVPQTFLHACADAAVGVVVALTERATSGLGQHVEHLGAAVDDAGDPELRPRRAARRAPPPSGRPAASRPAASTSSCCGRARTASRR